MTPRSQEKGGGGGAREKQIRKRQGGLKKKSITRTAYRRNACIKQPQRNLTPCHDPHLPTEIHRRALQSP